MMDSENYTVLSWQPTLQCKVNIAINMCINLLTNIMFASYTLNSIYRKYVIFVYNFFHASCDTVTSCFNSSYLYLTSDPTVHICVLLRNTSCHCKYWSMYRICIFIFSAIFSFTTGLKVLFDPFLLHKQCKLPSDWLPLTEMQRLKDDHLSMSVRFFSLPDQLTRWVLQWSLRSLNLSWNSKRQELFIPIVFKILFLEIIRLD